VIVQNYGARGLWMQYDAPDHPLTIINIESSSEWSAGSAFVGAVEDDVVD
jgi:hypothetical protein